MSDNDSVSSSDDEAVSDDESKDEDEDSIGKGRESLVAALPDLLAVVMEDVMGKVAMARDPESGYIPKFPMVESKTCRSFDTFECIARNIPFLPHPCVYQLTTPLLSALGEGGSREIKTVEAVSTLFSRLIAGMNTNETVNGDTLVQFATAVVRDNLRVTGIPSDSSTVSCDSNLLDTSLDSLFKMAANRGST